MRHRFQAHIAELLKDGEDFLLPDAQRLVELRARLQDVGLTSARNRDLPVCACGAEEFGGLRKTGFGMLQITGGLCGRCCTQ